MAVATIPRQTNMGCSDGVDDEVFIIYLAEKDFINIQENGQLAWN